jgi:hypothetical protein
MPDTINGFKVSDAMDSEEFAEFFGEPNKTKRALVARVLLETIHELKGRSKDPGDLVYTVIDSLTADPLVVFDEIPQREQYYDVKSECRIEDIRLGARSVDPKSALINWVEVERRSVERLKEDGISDFYVTAHFKRLTGYELRALLKNAEEILGSYINFSLFDMEKPYYVTLLYNGSDFALGLTNVDKFSPTTDIELFILNPDKIKDLERVF